MKNLYTDVQWKTGAKYVTVDDLEIRNHSSISMTTGDANAIVAMTDIQKFSETKEGSPQLFTTVSLKSNF